MATVEEAKALIRTLEIAKIQLERELRAARLKLKEAEDVRQLRIQGC